MRNGLLIFLRCVALAVLIFLTGCATGTVKIGDAYSLSDADEDGYTLDNDCDDYNSSVHPDASELCDDALDNDCDGATDEDCESTIEDLDGDGVTSAEGDCDDEDASVYPGADERCDLLDNDCDGDIDEDFDQDGDGYLDASACEDGDDCDDLEAAINPGAVESCNDLDDDCDLAIDEDAVDAPVWYDDLDGDGYGDDATAEAACDQPANTSSVAGDCDDLDALVNPSMTEDCDTAWDDDCDPGNDTSGETWYEDGDGDGYGDPAAPTVTQCDQPVGYEANADDCDDDSATVHPGADEYCDGVDEDCDGTIDDNASDATEWFADVDGDGYGDSSSSQFACSAPANHVADNTDCNDADGSIYPSATEVCDGVDQSCEGTIDEGFDLDGDGFLDAAACATGTDCNDGDGSIYPGGTETCDGVDEDCDGTIDDNASDATEWFADVDGDSYGDAASSQFACSAPANHVADNTDCDDGNASISPADAEVCDDVDQDCDGTADNGLPTATYYQDADSDGYGGSTSIVDCAAPAGYVATGGDCDDAASSVNPGASESCNDADDDCDGTADDGLATTTSYPDLDGDTYGDDAGAVVDCAVPASYVLVGGDCDDNDNFAYPGGTETCDGVDEDCDGTIDNGLSSSTYYEDADGDTYGNAAASQLACSAPAGYVVDDTDCDDGDAGINPGAAEQYGDAEDEDCDDVPEIWYISGTTFCIAETVLSGCYADGDAYMVGESPFGPWSSLQIDNRIVNGDCNSDGVVDASDTCDGTMWCYDPATEYFGTARNYEFTIVSEYDDGDATCSTAVTTNSSSTWMIASETGEGIDDYCGTYGSLDPETLCHDSGLMPGSYGTYSIRFYYDGASTMYGIGSP
jgi:hypothetical protein